MFTTVAGSVVVVLFALGLVHVYWGFGGRFGKAVAIPERDGRPSFVPSKGATFVVAGCLFAAAFVVLVAAHTITTSFAPAARIATFGLAVVFAGRVVGDFRLVGIFKKVRGTRFARLDDVVYVPLCLALAIGVGYVAYADV